MGSIFRSAKMSLWQICLEREAAYQCVSEVGELGRAEFRDLNPDMTAFQRNYAREIRKCDELEKKLTYMEKDMEKDDIAIPDLDVIPNAPLPKDMVDLEAALDKLHTELTEVNDNMFTLKKNALELTELKTVLMNAQNHLDQVGASEASQDETDLDIAEEAISSQNFQNFKYLSGVISMERAAAFELMLFRAGRGNILLRRAEISSTLEDPETGSQLSKVVFICFYQGEQLKARVKKICDGFHAQLYPCPDSSSKRRELLIGVGSRLEDLKIVVDQTEQHRKRILLASAKNIRRWIIQIRKVKLIYHTMNMFSTDVTSRYLVAECWIPDDDVNDVYKALERGNKSVEGASSTPVMNKMPTTETPPTFHRTNKFTKGYQALVNSYGMAAYREVNPGLYTCASFPFLFAIMFGDTGHGFILFLFALFMVVQEKKLAKIKGEIWYMFFGGRYIILMMSLFSMYTGLIYNDVFSKSINLFGSSWLVNYDDTYITKHESLTMDPKRNTTCDDGSPCGGHYSQAPYPLGMDPVWQLAENKIVYLNSFKMKTSIVMAVFHMTFGIVLNLWNYTYFKRYSAFFLEFLPKILFFLLLFGYMMVLFFIKWIKYGAANESRETQSDCAPSILITFINMMLMKYEDTAEGTDCKTVFLFEHQEPIQKAFLLVALVCVPVMLFGTPIMFLCTHKKKTKHAGNDDEAAMVSSTTLAEEEEEESFGDVMIHQAIHTIEYTLECISHSASYLRLWALSLAHSQLSEVLWMMTLRISLLMGGWVGSVFIFLVFAFWAGASVAILILMEGMSAFLHTLRLHWVEFQSKFYMGTGIAFHPFNFKLAINGDPEA